MAIVEESGCGKSVTANAILGLIRTPGVIKPESEIEFMGRNILGMNKKEWRQYRGGQCAMIFQDALSSLNPTMKVGKQIAENLIVHNMAVKKDSEKTAIDLLKKVGIPNAEQRAKEYPHQFSGGMRQRAMIATALACNPQLLIADEPTTALDVTIQAQIIDLMKTLQKETGTAIVLITHDLGVVAGIAQNICVMYSGKIVERGDVEQIFYSPKHPYTWALLSAAPRLDLENKEELATIQGTPPDLLAPPAGCPFSTRCKFCMPICKTDAPPETNFEEGHSAHCWLHDPRAPKIEAPFQCKEA